MNVIDWLMDSDPAVRWQVMRDLTDAPPDDVAAALKSLFPNYPADQLTKWAERFTKLFSQSIYKWVQSPMSLHVGSLDLDRERALQMPIVQRNEWH